jgi:hypothetical protein
VSVPVGSPSEGVGFDGRDVWISHLSSNMLSKIRR